ncbi:1474_t:CDS:2 [Entrophospora sp. SA101]|nr:1474_t:CDS:2 [Entrophospora sp. SA101]CAJ0899553.1 13317_t:CDS:2 [Entrophospora sp. SA101]
MGGGRILAKVTELVTVKLGMDTEGLLNTIITTATTVAATYAGGATAAGAKGKVAKKLAATSARAVVGAAGGMAQLAHNELMTTPTYSETTHTMTFHEFRHKYLFSKDRPISLWVEYNQELANQYRNKRELKGPMFYNYTNLDFLGRVLSQKDFLKASKKLSDAVVATSEGGMTLGGAGETILITADISDADYSNVDYIGNQDYTYNFTSGGSVVLKTRNSGPQTATIPSGGGKVILRVRGSTAQLVSIGEKPETVRNPSGIPEGIPPSKTLPTDPTYANNPPTTPFNPNQFPSSGNLVPNPTGSDQGIDVDLGQDIDPTKDTDKGKDDEVPPDYDPYGDND